MMISRKIHPCVVFGERRAEKTTRQRAERLGWIRAEREGRAPRYTHPHSRQMPPSPLTTSRPFTISCRGKGSLACPSACSWNIPKEATPWNTLRHPLYVRARSSLLPNYESVTISHLFHKFCYRVGWLLGFFPFPKYLCQSTGFMSKSRWKRAWPPRWQPRVCRLARSWSWRGSPMLRQCRLGGTWRPGPGSGLCWAQASWNSG